MTYNISISGKIGSGKSHLGQNIYDWLYLVGYSVILYPMAKTLKQLAAKMCDDPVKNYDTAFNTFASFEYYGINEIDAASKAVAKAYQEYGHGVVGKKRKFLQILGHDIGREMLHPDVWVRERNKAIREYDVAIADDLRYDNEISYPGVHIAIYLPRGQEIQINSNTVLLDPEYTHSDHESEKSLTHHPDYKIPYMYSPSDLTYLLAYLSREINKTKYEEEYLNVLKGLRIL